MNLRYSIPFVSIYLTPNASAACYCDRNSIYNNNDNEFLDDENLFEIQKKNAFPLWVNFGRLKLSRCFEHVVNLAHLHRAHCTSKFFYSAHWCSAHLAVKFTKCARSVLFFLFAQGRPAGEIRTGLVSGLSG